MLTAALLLLVHTLTWQLRLSDAANSFPKPLTAAQERHYLALYAAGDESAREVLIEHNLRLVAHILKKYYTQADQQDDLISIGTIGLIKAVSTFNATKGARLATYAARCIENEILMYFRAQKKTAGDVSLSECIETGKDGAELSLIDVISVDDADMFDQLSAQELQGKLRGALERCLEPREREIIRLRYGLSGQSPLTQRQTAERFGISRSYVSRIEKRALEKLRREIDP